ncbi:ABC transporter permease subunit [Solibacillus daqui]|uniref:ABC transporter permease subunit n=1 Tax=Solibacillus daqui TaxID=2912187 RepID=UPI002367207F|nr:ABC transporter permease subunit [Solibacillus daqui]
MTDINILRVKKWRMTGIFVVIIGLLYGSSVLTKFNLVEGIESIPGTFAWMVANLIPSAESLENLPRVLESLWETIILSMLVTTTAAIFALLFALMGAKTTQVSHTFGFIVRFIASVFRNIPVVAWALVLVISFGHNVITGYFALFFSTFGILVRMFIETIDETSSDGVEALTSTGASYFQMVFRGVIPDTLPQMLSWVFYMIETNIRSATLVGILTGTGIGFLFDMYYKRMDYGMLGLITIAIVIIVMAIEFSSNYVRRAIS